MTQLVSHSKNSRKDKITFDVEAEDYIRKSLVRNKGEVNKVSSQESWRTHCI